MHKKQKPIDQEWPLSSLFLCHVGGKGKVGGLSRRDKSYSINAYIEWEEKSCFLGDFFHSSFQGTQQTLIEK